MVEILFIILIGVVAFCAVAAVLLLISCGMLALAMYVLHRYVPPFMELLKVTAIGFAANFCLGLAIGLLFAVPLALSGALRPGAPQHVALIANMASQGVQLILGFLLTSWVYGKFLHDEDGYNLGFGQGCLVTLVTWVIAIVAFILLLIPIAIVAAVLAA